jgi:apolipoprotein N-acyltransferase
MNQAGVVVTALPGVLPVTPYARFGLWIPLVLALAAVASGGSRKPSGRNRNE